MSGRKIGFLGGTFDPIHHGHINLALELSERAHLDFVYFCPSFLSPLKTAKPSLVAGQHRLEMVRMAIKPIASFQLLEEEMHDKKITFTIDTIKKLKSQHLGDELFLLLGEDIVGEFQLWKDYEELIMIAEPLIGTRIGYNKNLSLLSLKAQKAFEKGFISIHHLNISSTYIRERLSKRLYCQHLMPANIVDYIHKHRLYSSS